MSTAEENGQADESTAAQCVESNERDRKGKMTQHTAALCFGILFVVVGLPLWWKTTEVYRVALPYGDIQTLAEKKIEYLTEVTVIWAVEGKKEKVDLSELAVHLNQKLGVRQDTGSTVLLPAFKVAVRPAESKEIQAIEKIDHDLSQIFTSTQLNSYVVVITKASLKLSQPLVSPMNVIYIAYNGAEASSLSDQVVQLVKDVVRSASVEKTLAVTQGRQMQRPDKNAMRSFGYHTGFDITFTLMVPEPDKVDAKWDIEAGINDYLNPLFSSLEEYTQISASSQVLYFAGLGGKPRQGENFFYFEEKDLPHVINPLESKLGSHASNNPSLNFIVCLPLLSKSPLHIQDGKGSKLESDAFLSPRWGGVMIYNVDHTSISNQTRPVIDIDMHRVMEVFVSQMRLLLNIEAQLTTSEALVLSSGSSELHQWEVAAWLRCRCIENLATSTATLKSLAQLLEEIGNIVINDEIGKEVESAVKSIKVAHDLLATGQLKEAFLASRDAFSSSELAFFHPSLLELLYFPEDQKFAIYIPLFLPISIPVVTATFNAIKWLRQCKKEKKD